MSIEGVEGVSLTPVSESKHPSPRSPNTPAPESRRQQGGWNGDRNPPPPHKNHGAGTRTGNAEGREPHGTALPAPCKGTSRNARTGKRGGGVAGAGHQERGRRESERAPTHKGHAA